MKPHPGSILDKNWVLFLFLSLVIGCGAFLRFTDLSAPLLDFHPTRQLFGAIKARGIYYSNLPQAPEWQKDLAIRLYTVEATIEPPIMENLAAGFYQQFGVETAIPRAISAAFWMIGGVFLFLVAKDLTRSNLAATVGLGFYLLNPIGVIASRAFQPDPLMVMLILAFWWCMENWARKLSWRWAILSGLFGGLAILVKFTAFFFVSGAGLGLILAYPGLKKSLHNPQAWVIILLGALPPGAYLVYGTVLNGFLSQQFAGRFVPEMWFTPIFYLRWFLKLNNVVNELWLILALLGWLAFSRDAVKKFLGSLWVTYAVYGMISTHHISSHDYYSLPVIPIVGLCLAQFLSKINAVENEGSHLSSVFEKLDFSRSLQITSIFLLLSALPLVSIDQYYQRRANDYRPEVKFWTKIGDTIGHQPGLLALTSDYGYPLAYYGWQKSSPWPVLEDIKNFDNTFNELTANKSFFLITDFVEYDRQPALQERLETNYPILYYGNGYIVFDLLHPKN